MKDAAVAWRLALTAEREAQAPAAEGASGADPPTFRATVRVGVAEEASAGLDERDEAAPPGRFEAVSLGLLAEGLPEKKPAVPELAADYRPADASEQGAHFTIVLRSTPGEAVTLRAQGLEALPSGRKALLVREATGERFELAEPFVLTPRGATERFALAVGPEDFIEAKARAFAPGEPALSGSYPNPFRDRATILYDVAEASDVRLDVYDVSRRRVRALVDGPQEPGRKTVTFQARDLASGMYLLRLRVGHHLETGRLVLVR